MVITSVSSSLILRGNDGGGGLPINDLSRDRLVQVTMLLRKRISITIMLCNRD
jgi:hypothetical protein